MCVERVHERVLKGGHSVPEADIRRRFLRSVANFWWLYRRTRSKRSMNSCGSVVLLSAKRRRRVVALGSRTCIRLTVNCTTNFPVVSIPGIDQRHRNRPCGTNEGLDRAVIEGGDGCGPIPASVAERGWGREHRGAGLGTACGRNAGRGLGVAVKTGGGRKRGFLPPVPTLGARRVESRGKRALRTSPAPLRRRRRLCEVGLG
jgi:hypothetical protein